MERLTTKWCPSGYDTFDPIDVIENEYSKINYEKVLQKLGEYEDLEEQGLLLRLPCKVGDYVWSAENGRVKKFVVSHFEVCMKSIYAFQGDVFIGEMGFTVFATREEAEAALEKMKGEGHETDRC